MFQTVFEKITGFLDQRFILTVWIPSLFFWVALLCLLAGWAKPSMLLKWWQREPLEWQLGMIVLLLAWITLFARVLLSVLDSLFRVYEGYWKRLPFLSSFKKRRQRYYAEKIRDLKNSGNDAEILSHFPPTAKLDEVMPTRMGNILKNSEIYPELRYGMNAVLMWPRLYNVLPDGMTKNFAAAATELEFMLVISTLGVAFAFAGGIIATTLLPWYVVPICFLGSLLVAWLGYEGALRSASSYNLLVKAAFDLHRGTLLKTIGWLPATSYHKEKAQWQRISQLWLHGPIPTVEGALPLGYEPEKTAQTEEKFGYVWLKNGAEVIEGTCLLTANSTPEKLEK